LIFTSVLEKNCGMIRYPSTVSCVRDMIIATLLHTRYEHFHWRH
jgi:hypothetical protein